MSVARRSRTVSAYVALGDSFTAGRGSADGERWADQLAARLRRDSPELDYRNLAVDGATSAEVLEQLPAALALEPDLVTVICGANDVLLTSRPDVDGYEDRFGQILGDAARRARSRGGDRHRDRAGVLALHGAAAADQGPPDPGPGRPQRGDQARRRRATASPASRSTAIPA